MVVNADFFSGSKTRKLNSSENQLHFSLHKSHSFPHNGIKKIWKKNCFPSISDYFHIPIIFDYFNILCPTEAMTVGTIFFPVRVEEQFFFQYGLECLGNFQVQVLISVVLNKNSKSRK